MSNKTVLIVGAGPTGLTAAILLTQANHEVRIIDKLTEPVDFSKAMAVNPRSLQLLEESGITPTILETGKKLRYIRLGLPNKPLAALDLEMAGHRYGHMVGLPQSETESLLTAKLKSLGVEIERGTEFLEFRQTDEHVECKLQRDGESETVGCDFLVGANGASSNIRKQLGADFIGETIPGDWHMADVKLAGTSSLAKSLTPDALHVIFMGKGFLFAVAFTPGIYRIATNHPDVFKCLPADETIESVEWESMFTINHRLTSSYAQGRVALAGDAAHVHSPIGGRGMNLGIEDAAYLTAAITEGDLEQYAISRHKTTSDVMRLVNIQTKMALGSSPLFRFVRRYIMPMALSTPFIHKRLVRRFTGLNHSSDIVNQ